MADTDAGKAPVGIAHKQLGSSQRSDMTISKKVQLSPWRQKLASALDSRAVTVLMTVFTIYALFGDDIRLASAPPSSDNAFYGISFVALCLFSLELLANSVAKPEYPGRFYFWLDLMATLSLIPDIGWLWEPIVGEDGNAADGSTGAIRAGRASRAGTKAGRIVRIVRLVRLIRIVKLYKHVKEGHLPSQGPHTGPHEPRRVSQPLVVRAPRRSSARQPQTDPHNMPAARKSTTAAIDEPSQVGKTLSDLTTRRVILLVLAMIIVTPFFSLSTYSTQVDASQEFGLVSIHKLVFNPNEELFRSTLDEYLVSAGTPLHISIYNQTQEETLAFLRDSFAFNEAEYLDSVPKVTSDFRSAEAPLLSVGLCYDESGNVVPGQCRSFVYFNERHNTSFEALLNIFKTVFVMLVLAVSALLFTKDAEHLVIRPIERMVHIVKQLAENPLNTVMDPSSSDPALGGSAGGYETQLLERTLHKIGGLLQIGFGEAGSQIIAQNMKRGGSLNPMVDGVKMRGVFGFCDIRQFTDVTECLQEEVMVFVNQVGDIVHFATHQYAGAANKNIGDAFLLVWRVVELRDTGAMAEWHRQQSSKRMTLTGSQKDMAAAVAGGAASGAGQSATGKFTEKSAAVLPLSMVAGDTAGGQSPSPAPQSAAGGDGDVDGGMSCRSSVPLPETGSTAGVPPVAVKNRTDKPAGKLRIPAPHRASLSGVTTVSPGHSTDPSAHATITSETQLADNALYAFLKCMVDIENSNMRGLLLKYQEHPKIMERFPMGFRVRMGFGLHFGWAIEGAIGSVYKIDASYLSPNVNIAARLEAATKQFDVPLLMSSDFTRRLSPAARDRCRLLDSVTVKGSKLPIQLYTFDINHYPSVFGCNIADAIVDADFEHDPHVPMLQQGMPGAFFKHFRRGVRHYLNGHWQEAKLELQMVQEVWPEDGPTQTLMRVMGAASFVAPVGWAGFRELTDK